MKYFLLTLLLNLSIAMGYDTDQENYHFPIPNALDATIATAILPTPSETQVGLNRIQILNGRKEKLEYKYLQSPSSKRSLVIQIVGIGGDAKANVGYHFAKIIQKHSDVVTMPNPFSSNFQRSASKNSYVGITSLDVIDLYNAIKIVLADIQKNTAKTYDEIKIFSFSLGSVYAILLDKYNQENGDLPIVRNLLVNPPVSLSTALNRLTKYGNEKINIFGLRSFANITAKYQKKGSLTEEDILAYSQSIQQLTDSEKKFVISYALKTPLAEISLYTQEANPIENDLFPEDPGTGSVLIRNILRRKQNIASKMNLNQYVNFILIPYLQKSEPSYSLLDYEEESSLFAHQQFLQENDHIQLIHSRDDMLVNEREMAFLEETFLERAQILNYGGHLGSALSLEMESIVIDGLSLIHELPEVF